MAEHTAWLLLGSNIHPEKNLSRAVNLLARKTALLGVSPVWQSPPADGSDQPDYLNAAVRIRTALNPEELLAQVIAPIERELGRERSADKFAPRTIDIDLALYDDRIGGYSGKQLPHPDILTRAHAALPLAGLSPDALHPVTGERLEAIAARLRHPGIRLREDLTLGPKK
ncbi:MAG: 2-amino-4-hydroxy-6-hydroxymethyldihydropteridine diphosphokinase [Anaerolineales bacterium]|nr:2-amino-4-hydroxy-6-hydroxymethyldihydropteridine diphosphokinase [Anaerolineales bacterium]